MKKSKKIIAFTLAMILAFSVMVVGASTINAGALSKVSFISACYDVDATVSLKWSKDASCGYYQIAKKKAGDKNYTYIDVSYFSDQYYCDKNVVSGTVYYYQVRSVSMLAGGTTYGPWSATKAITTLYRPSVTNLNDMGTMLNINWTKIKGASYFKLAFKRLTDKAWNYRNVKSSYYNVPNPTKGATYAVQVCPINGSVTGQWSPVKYVFIGTQNAKPVIWGAEYEDGIAYVGWTYPVDCKYYTLYYKKATAYSWTLGYADDVEGTENVVWLYVDPGETYYFQIRACDKYGKFSKYSSVYTLNTEELQIELR